MNEWEESKGMQITNESNNSFEIDNLKPVLTEYKSRFVELWANENYKWEAIKCFQDNWNVEADDFSQMLEKSLKKTDNLLTTSRRFARGMILEYAVLFPDDVRGMFISLFDESKDFFERVQSFHDKADELLPKWMAAKGINESKVPYQSINAITTYLWLKYPDKYYIYKFSVFKDVSERLNSSLRFKKGANPENLRNYISLFNEIKTVVQSDNQLKALLVNAIGEKFYPDPFMNTMAGNICYFISRYYGQSSDDISDNEDDLDDMEHAVLSDEWSPSSTEYTPGISKEQWMSILNDKTIIGPVWGGVLAAFYRLGGTATCSQIAQKYKKDPSGISGNCTQLAKAIYKKIQCPLWVEDGKKRYWPILFQGKKAGSSIPGAFVWRLRPELYEALIDFEISRYEWSVDNSSCQYWWLNANPRMWSFYQLAVGECQEYDLYNDSGNKRRVFQNFMNAKVGDRVIGYESTPRKQIEKQFLLGKWKRYRCQ